MGRFYEWEPFAEGKTTWFRIVIHIVFWKGKCDFYSVEATGL